MKLEINPHIGVGPITFGMTDEQVRATLKCEYREFKRTPISKTVTDSFQSLGMFICYDIERKCNAIEMARPAQPYYGNCAPLSGSFTQASELIKILDSEVVCDSSGLTSFTLGIGLNAPGCCKNSSSPVESVIVFQRGYYASAKK